MRYVVNRSPYASEHRILTVNMLKIIAAICMVFDHVAVHLLDERMIHLHLVFRLIGRLAFPLFAYCVAEGCRYSKHKWRRFLIILGGGIAFELVGVVYHVLRLGGATLFDIYKGNIVGLLKFIRVMCLEGNIFLTLACSILLIHILQALKARLAEKKWANALLMGGLFVLAAVAAYFFDYLMNGLQYGFYGILLPVLVSVTDYEEGKTPEFFRKLDHPLIKLAFFALGLILVATHSEMKVVQTFALLALIPLAMYNGKPGSGKLKWWFYVFYPAHLIIIWIIGTLIS